MSQSILVTGGTGTLGVHVVGRLLEAGHPVRVLTRSPRLDTPYTVVGGDLTSGAGVDEAVAGADTIVHLASDPMVIGSDLEGARRLVEAARRAGTAHLVFISIVGVDRSPYFYYRAKYAAEQVIEASGLPYTILRTTQFHDFVLYVTRELARRPVMPVPMGWRFQPIDTGEVAERMVALASGGAAGRVPDMGGSETLTFRELMELYLAGLRRPLVPVPVPGRISAAFRRGAHLVEGDGGGRRTYGAFLADQVKPGQPVGR
ncbi:nucleotide-diphosphate-sugar epimerase [Planotetraspora silvatica]|uniref:Nucleotide-diphosphate-sugar epimerase n=1 Tax=Planotetraspora silvatica TaxID=234614 RepID=A0A8J3USG2_9ACTN|nr:NAD(P)H-binding protein [Planotetraspora silvatica]GII49781.1 nucleotide-diphosphate-sugar epimerase [Planotetraspora silvatica]